MIDYFDQFNKQKEINEGLFGNLFSKTGNTQQASNTGNTQQAQQTQVNPNFRQEKDGTFVFGGHNTVKETSDATYLKYYVWEKSKLKFVVAPETNFKGESISFDLKKEKIYAFKNGIWESGPFIGDYFMNSIFQGSYFKGHFYGKNEDYRSEPYTFAAGSFHDITNTGILGKPNTLSLKGLGTKKFNIITIPPGNMLEFKSVNGKSSYIKVLKRLDKSNSIFQFEVLDGFKSDIPKIVTKDWQYFLENWDKKGQGILDINRNSINIAGLIVIPSGDAINPKEMFISVSTTTTKKTTPTPAASTFVPGKQYTFNLSKIPYLNIQTISGPTGEVSPDVNFSFDSMQEFGEFNKVTSQINSGALKQDIKNIARAIKYGQIDGYGNFQFLSPIFNNIPGQKAIGLAEAKRATKKFNFPKKTKPAISTPIAQPTQEPEKSEEFKSMQNLNNFIKYFVDNINMPDGSPNKEVQDLIISRLKTALGTENMAPIAPVTNPVTTSSSATPSKSSTKSSTKSIVSKGLGKGLPESIRFEIRKIINNNY